MGWEGRDWAREAPKRRGSTRRTLLWAFGVLVGVLVLMFFLGHRDPAGAVPVPGVGVGSTPSGPLVCTQRTYDPSSGVWRCSALTQGGPLGAPPLDRHVIGGTPGPGQSLVCVQKTYDPAGLRWVCTIFRVYP